MQWAKQSKWCTLNVIHYNAVLAGLARKDWLRSMQVSDARLPVIRERTLVGPPKWVYRNRTWCARP